MKKTKSLHIEFTAIFERQLNEAPLFAKIAFREVLELFLEDPQNVSLRNHPLRKLGKKYFGVRSIDVTGDWRALYRQKDERIIFLVIGTHSKLYT